MALTATATQGHEFLRYVQPNEVLWVAGDPGDTYTRGDIVTATVGEGVVDPQAAGEVPIGIVAKTTVCTAAATAGFPRFGLGQSRGWGQIEDDVTKTLVPIIPLIPVGTPITKCTFANQQDDENITAYTAGDPSVTVASVATDDYGNGAFIYVYGGTGVGQWNVVADATASSNKLTLHRKFETALDATSDVIWLSGEAAANRGVGFFNRVTSVDANTLDVSDGANDGEWTVYMDAREVAAYLSVLTIPVVPSGAFLMV